MTQRTSSDSDAETETSRSVAATSAPGASLGRPSPMPTYHDVHRPARRKPGALTWSILIAIAVVAALGVGLKWFLAG